MKVNSNLIREHHCQLNLQYKKNIGVKFMSLYRNINKRKKAGTSRSKKNSTISDEAYANMKAGFPKKKKKKKKKK
tara:strand:- start:2502 stop:2726 length:225 start_codon:yes stop_codon:yes gene_type:complete